MKNKQYSFLSYSLELLRYKKITTIADIFYNSIIFSYQAAVNFCVRQVLNTLDGTRSLALETVIPYLTGILLVAIIRIAAIMSCAALDSLHEFFYENRTRLNIFRLLLKKDDITGVAGHSGANFEVIANDVPISAFPAILLTEVSGYFVYTLISLTMLLAINWQLTLFIFIPLSAAIYLVQRLSQSMKEKRLENREAHDAASSFVSDITNTVLAVKAAGAEVPVLNHYTGVNKNRRLAILKDKLFDVKINVLLEAAVYIGSAIMMFVASRLMTSGSFGIGDFSLFIANLGTLADCVNRIVELVTEAHRAEVSYNRITDLVGRENAGTLNMDLSLKLRAERQESIPYYDHQPLSSFKVNNLSYDYGDGNGFHNVTFEAKPGELTVVAGAVGSGKSTLLSVLMGLIPSDNGEMILDGNPFRLDDRTPVKITGAPQRGGFFSKTLKENLCLDFPASQDEMMNALSIASLTELVTGDSHGFESEVGSRGARLSGGQLQRLALARTVLRGAQVCIIDDCVSALDEDTKRKVLARLSDYAKNTMRSVIIATNEKIFLESADKIICMDQFSLAYNHP